MEHTYKKLALLAAAAPCFTKRPDFSHGLDKSAVDGLIQQTYTDRPYMLKNFSQLFFQHSEKLSAEFNMWNLSLGLAASAYMLLLFTVQLNCGMQTCVKIWLTFRYLL